MRDVRYAFRLIRRQPVFAALGQWAGQWLVPPEVCPCPYDAPGAGPFAGKA